MSHALWSLELLVIRSFPGVGALGIFSPSRPYPLLNVYFMLCLLCFYFLVLRLLLIINYLFLQITLRPYVVREVQVTPTPAASEWDNLLPAIIVPSCIFLFLLIALIWAKCVAKGKRKQLIIKPTEVAVPFSLLH